MHRPSGDRHDREPTRVPIPRPGIRPDDGLGRGGHRDPADGRCAMEAVAALARQPHGDAPRTTCPILAAYVRALNDRIDDPVVRGLVLGPRLHTLLDTASHPEVERARAFAAADAAVRRFGASTLARLGADDAALELAALEAIEDRATATIARVRLATLGRGFEQALRPASWTVTMAARGHVPATLWVGATVRAAENSTSDDRWPWVAGELLDALIRMPREHALCLDLAAR